MSPVAQIVRRFELHAASRDELDAVERAVGAAVRAQPKGAVVSATDRIERPPVVEVQLEGVEPAVLDVVARLADLPTARIRNDVVKVRGAGRRGAIYPDPSLERRVNGRFARPGDALVPENGPSSKGKEVTVAIVDSGLMVDHEVFKGRLWTGPGGIHGKQFIDDKPQHDIRDQDGHGTALAGAVLEGAGDAPVRLLTAKFFDPANPARPDNAARALRFAVENDAKVIVLAWDVGMGSVELEEAFRAACAKALVVIAAGNYGSDNDWYEDQSTARVPVRYAKDYPESTLTVMATDEFHTKAWFSNYGRETVDLAAPGVDIATTRRALTDGPARTVRKFRRHTGTSPAAALVAGAAARLMSRYPKLEIAQVRDCLRDSVDEVPGLKCASEGRLNIDRADKMAGTL
jgi:subtilisin family serine protease